MHEKPHIPWRFTFDSIEDILKPLNVVIKEVQDKSSNSYTQIKFKETTDARKSSAQLISSKNLLTAEIVKTYLNNGMYASAEEVIEKINDDRVKSEIYSEIVRTYLNNSMYASAEEVIEKINDDRVKSEIYSEIVRTYLNNGMYASAEEIMNKIGKH